MTSVSATGLAGYLEPEVFVELSGVAGEGFVGTVVRKIIPDGVEAQGYAGTLSYSIQVGLSGTVANGTAGVAAPEIISPAAGVTAAARVGSIAVGDVLVAITGCRAMGQVGTFGYFYWSLVDDSETANWQNIDSTTAPSWSTLDTEESASWELLPTD